MRPVPLPSPETTPLHPNRLYLCQLCGNLARYPRLQTHTFKLPFGYRYSVDYVTPMVCVVCRLNRQDDARALGDGRRRFWKQVIALLTGEPYPSATPRMIGWLVRRNRLAFRLRETKQCLLTLKDIWYG